MSDPVTLTPDQIAEIERITNNNTANWDQAYNYIYSLIQDNPNVDDVVKTWFVYAPQINANLNTPASVYVRDVTQFGLEFSGQGVGNVQTASDDIGRNVIGD